MLDLQDLTAIARGTTTAIRQALQAFEARLGLIEQRSMGIQSVVIRNHEKDRRVFVQTMIMADGRKIESEFKMVGSLQYCEVYQPNRQYEMGDVVTNDGSMWVAIRDTDGHPGKSPDWRLAVKRGQDGKKL